MQEKISEKAAAFLVELEALCHKYQIQPCVSPWGTLQLYDREDGDRPVTDDCIEDRLGRHVRFKFE